MNREEFKQSLINKYSKDTIYDLYVNQKLSKNQISKTLGITNRSLDILFKYYNIDTNQSMIQSARMRENNIKTFNILCNEIPYDKLYEYYIIENHGYEETKNYFNLSFWKLDKLLKEYNIKKDRHISSKQGVITKYKKAGSKENYNDQILLTRNKTITAKYGSKANYYKQITAKMQETCLTKYGVPSIAQLPETAIKRADTRAKITAIDGEHFNSTWELLVYSYCKRNNIPVKRGIPLYFDMDGKQHSTTIDFEIDGLLVEVKGPHLLKGCFDYKAITPIQKKLEIYAQNNVIIVTNNEMIDLFKKSCGTKYGKALIGIDIDLFDKPDFPYNPLKPKCFYDVKVDSKYSSKEAFDNELIRWKMMKNRIEYVGGFINNKKILQALNVTRTAKQPSWFSKEYAEYLINKYITTDTIVDTFAGWGARCEASKACNKKYIGIDLNKELVEYHKTLNRNISLGNAETFTYNYECSVFICPPYQDIELYFEGQNTKLTQCDWLKILMQNIPNAKEYLMVCKVVDPGFEQYVVETKINKSHFGTNTEYVILIKR